MPFPVGHGLVGVSVFLATQQRSSTVSSGKILALCAVLAVLPDVDFVFDWVFQMRGWHRGFTHSLAFGIGLGLMSAAFLETKSFNVSLGLVLAAVSHGVLDALVTTTKGDGVALLWPFSNHRFTLGLIDYFPFRFNPRRDPWSEFVVHLFKISLVEFLIFGPLLLIVIALPKVKSMFGLVVFVINKLSASDEV